MFIEQSSGWKRVAAAARSSRVIVTLPPVVMLITASVAALIWGRNWPKTSGSAVGLPVSGSRAWRWRIAAPASAAAIACAAICSGVVGRCGVWAGTWIAPVIAQLMIRFELATALFSSPGRWRHNTRDVKQPKETRSVYTSPKRVGIALETGNEEERGMSNRL